MVSRQNAGLGCILPHIPLSSRHDVTVTDCWAQNGSSHVYLLPIISLKLETNKTEKPLSVFCCCCCCCLLVVFVCFSVFKLFIFNIVFIFYTSSSPVIFLLFKSLLPDYEKQIHNTNTHAREYITAATTSTQVCRS